MNLYALIAYGMDQDIPNPSGYYDILKHLTGEQYVDPTDVLEAISGCDLDRTHVGNVHLNILFERIQDAVEQQHPHLSVTYFLNAMDSRLWVTKDGSTIEVHDLEDFLSVLTSSPP